MRANRSTRVRERGYAERRRNVNAVNPYKGKVDRDNWEVGKLDRAIDEYQDGHPNLSSAESVAAVKDAPAFEGVSGEINAP